MLPCTGDAYPYLKMWLHGGIQKARNYLSCSILGPVSMFLSGCNHSISKLDYVGNSQYLLLAFVIALLSLLPLPPLCSQPHFCLSQKAFSWLLDFCKISRKQGPLSFGLDYFHCKPSVGLYFNLNRTWFFERVYDKKEKSSSAEESTHSGRCIQGG